MFWKRRIKRGWRSLQECKKKISGIHDQLDRFVGFTSIKYSNVFCLCMCVEKNVFICCEEEERAREREWRT